MKSNDDLHRPKVAVVVHLYYEERWSQIACHLRRINEPFDLIITTPAERASFIETQVMPTFPSASIHVVPNLGMDVLAFMRVIPKLLSSHYCAVCKIHTKNRRTHAAHQLYRSD